MKQAALPHKSESQGATGLTQKQTKTDTAIVHDLDGERKAYLTLQAQLALRGYSLNELSTGNYLVSRWDLTLHANDLASVRQFYARIGGRP